MKNIIVISSGHYTSFCKTLFKLKHLKSAIKIRIFAPYKNPKIEELKEIFDIELNQISKKPSLFEYKDIADQLTTIDCTVLVYSKYLIPSCIYNIKEAINFHPSKLPNYPGLKGGENALKNRELAFTAHTIDETVDLGKKIISCQIKPFPNVPGDAIKAMSHELCQIISAYVIEKSIKKAISSLDYTHYESTSIESLSQEIQ